MKSVLAFWSIVVISGWLLISPALGEKCSGVCDMVCPSSGENCTQSCGGGDCSMECDATKLCAQICLRDTKCNEVLCNTGKCAQQCHGTCPKIECTAKHCVQSCLKEKCSMSCDDGECSQKALGRGSSQTCSGSDCTQMCTEGECQQTCDSGPCSQACGSVGGCGQTCSSTERCSQLCTGGNCNQQAKAKMVTQDCSIGDGLGGCDMKASGDPKSTLVVQKCTNDVCKMEVSSAYNATVMCFGLECDVTCTAKHCLVFCNATASCNMKCAKADKCGMICESQSCKTDCNDAKMCTTDVKEYVVKDNLAVADRPSLFVLFSTISLMLVQLF